PFRLDYSWFLIFIFVTVMLSMSLFPNSYPEWNTAYYWIVGVDTSLLFFGSVVVHELAHSLVSKKTGIPVKSITLFLFGGVAQIGKEASQPRVELVITLAGPLSSALLGALFYGLSYLFLDVNVYLFALTRYLGYVNLLLAIFNMTPGFPLDGGRVLRSLVWMATGNFMRATRIATTAGYWISISMIVAGFLILLLWGYFDGLWLIIIGFFINSAARSTYQQTMLREHLKGFTAQDVMNRELPRIPWNVNLLDLVQGTLMRSTNPFYLVTDGDGVAGVLTLWQIKRVPQRDWGLVTARQVMMPVEQMKRVSPGDDALSVLEKIDESQADAVAVVSEGRVVGVILRDSLIEFARRLQVLKG
ncbi:MAG: site-2 protease family protein, partial [Chloroflexota bacterium]|nr:site-2 protease family protein [Chloroflexota bacterium]